MPQVIECSFASSPRRRANQFVEVFGERAPLTVFRVWLQETAHPYIEGVVMEMTHPEEVGGWKRP